MQASFSCDVHPLTLLSLPQETAVETTQGAIHSFQPDLQQQHPPQQQFNNMSGGVPLNLQNLDIPPDLQQILQQIPLQGGGGPQAQMGQQHMPGNEPPSPNPTITNVQNLLSSMMVREVSYCKPIIMTH